LNYLRISITDRCNLRCCYCQPNGLRKKLPHAEILSYEEILRIVRIGVGLGIRKVRVTGGEPLVRKGAGGFLREMTSLEGLSDVSLTTNGVLLTEHLDTIRAAGIRRINISLDTLKREKYKEITGRDAFDRVWSAILAAEGKGFDPIKLNAVALRGINEDELIDLAGLTFQRPYHVRFIEYMPMGPGGICPGPALLTPDIKQRIAGLGELIPVSSQADDGPAERYRFRGARGEVGFISALSRHFCRTCNRLRLTASGQLRVCLLSDRQFDLKGPMRSGASDRQLAEVFMTAVASKPSSHPLAGDAPFSSTCQMSSIGG